MVRKTYLTQKTDLLADPSFQVVHISSGTIDLTGFGFSQATFFSPSGGIPKVVEGVLDYNCLRIKDVVLRHPTKDKASLGAGPVIYTQ